MATLALAIGIGSATAIYTAVHSVLLKPLPYREGDRLVALYSATFVQPEQRSFTTYPDLLTYQRQNHSFDLFGWFTTLDLNLTSPGEPQHILVTAVTPWLVAGLGDSPSLGRWFRDPAHEPGGYQVIVISNNLWNRLGSDPAIVGKTVTLNGQPFTVEGVMPRWFRLPVGSGPGEQMGTQAWIPLDPHEEAQNAKRLAYPCYARLRLDVTLQAASADIKRIAARIARADPSTHPSYTARVELLRMVTVAEIRPTLLLLFAAAALLLLITCGNVAGLLVARSVARARETAVRVALGASQAQLASTYFAEGLLVALAGSALSVLLSVLLVRVVVRLTQSHIPRAQDVHLDGSVLLFAVFAALFASVLSSLAPLWQVTRTRPNEALGDGARASAGRRTRRLSQVLVIIEIALAFTLLGGSALLISQLVQLLRVNPGFDAEHVLTFDLTAAGSEYPTQAKLVSLQRRLLASIESQPGIESAAIINQIPANGCCLSTLIYPEGMPLRSKEGQRVSILVVSSGYTRTVKIPLRAGRFLTDADSVEDPARVVINRAAAATYWQGRNALGAFGRISSEQGSRFQVVGIVGDIKNNGLDQPTVPEIYISSTVAPLNPMHFLVRSSLPNTVVIEELRRAVRRVDPAQPVDHFSSMKSILQESVQLQRASSFVTAFFACAALLLSGLGIYGVIAYSVRQRTVELGTRLALGAETRDLVRLVLGQGVKMAGYGTTLGMIATALACWLLWRAALIQRFELVPFLLSIAVVLAISLAASSFPAWRAARLSPMAAIRYEPGSLWQDAQQTIRRFATGIALPKERAAQVRESDLLAGFVQAARTAQSFDQALQLSLLALCEALETDTGLLYGRGSGGDFTCLKAVSAEHLEVSSLPAAGLLVLRLQTYSAALPLSAEDLAAWLKWAREEKPQHVPEIETLTALGVRLAVALRTRNEISGLLLLGGRLQDAPYGPAEKQALQRSADQFALMIENGRLTDRVVEQEKLRRDLSLAAEVQRRLLPEAPPHSELASFAAFSLPARTVGGDYYDFLELGERRIGIALADVSGKGIAAALVMSVVQASLRIISAESELSLPQLTSKLNRFVHRSTGANSYATFFYAQLDEQNGLLRYVNAGHNPPYLLRAVAAELAGASNGTKSMLEELSTGGMIIGMFPQAKYEEAAVELRTGDVFVAFTDGVTEAMSPQEEEFGEERLKALLRCTAHLSAEEMASSIKLALREWIRDAAQHDDVTFVILKVG